MEERMNDDYDYTDQWDVCGICGMRVPASARICPYCGATKYATKKEYDAAQRNMIIFAICCFVLAAMAFCH